MPPQKISLRVYVDPDEIPMIDEAAKREGLSRSTWAKRTLLKQASAVPAQAPSVSLPITMLPPPVAPVLPREWAQNDGGSIVLLVMDGVGDIPDDRGRTPLEAARTPNLDRIARKASLGRTIPIAPGVTAGSVAGHLALLGYDPMAVKIGRGPIDALGVGVDLQPGDVVMRGNFATVKDGIVIDRRAGRLPGDTAAELCFALNAKLRFKFEGIETQIAQTAEHRFVLHLRGNNLSPQITDTDPGQNGLPAKPCRANAPQAARTAEIVNIVAKAAADFLMINRANAILLRGAGARPHLASFNDHYGLNAMAVATYPTYRGIAAACGMELYPMMPSDAHDAINFAVSALQGPNKHQFIFIHYKNTDTAGEDGNFDAKVAAIEHLDAALKPLVDQPPDVLVVAGDHPTPVAMRGHSWHPVPLMIASKWTPGGKNQRYTERQCADGELGTIKATDVMALAMGHAKRLRKIDT